MEKTKTIFIPVYGRQQARNILRTRVLVKLQERKDIRIVLIVPEYKRAEFEKEFKNYKILFEWVNNVPSFFSKADSLFGRIALFYVNSRTVRFSRKESLIRKKQPVRYFFSLILLYIIGNSNSIKSILRYLDFTFVVDERFKDLFIKYKPDLVFAPRIDLPFDRSFLRHAKKRSIQTIGMINSWDNITISKYPFRILPNILIVHNEILKEEAVHYLGVQREKIRISGLPHFDHYIVKERVSREDFYNAKSVSLDKRFVLFASITSALNPTEWQVLKMLDDAIRDGRLPNDIVVIARHHPVSPIDIGELKASKYRVFDDSKTVIGGNTEYTEITTKDMNHLADSLFHTEMTIATASTMTIDAAAFDKPSISIAFDGWDKKPLHESVRRFYMPSHEHYQSIVKSGGTRIAYSFEELLEYINMYLADHSVDHKGRMRIVKEQCYKLDGKSGERIVEFILEVVE